MPKFMKALGRNTLFYYAFHNQAYTFVMIATGLITGMNIDKTYLKTNRLLWLAIVIIAMLIMILPCFEVNKLAPFFVGKKMSETNAVWLKKSKKQKENA